MCKRNYFINSTVPCSGYADLNEPTKLADNNYFQNGKGPIRETNGKKTMYSRAFTLAGDSSIHF